MSKPKKSLGQNFLIDKNIISKIINNVEIKNKIILEVGPGTGNLTEKILLKNPKKLIIIEKDKTLFQNLKLKFNKFSNLKILNCDFLKLNLDKIVKEKMTIVGNLPYNISTQILVKWIKFQDNNKIFEKLILMFQKEVADKIIASNNSKNYGRISIISKYNFNVIRLFNISNNCFFPKPKVMSSILLFKPKNNITNKLVELSSLEKITNVFFNQKRKIIKKPMSKLFKNPDLVARKIGIKLSIRPENINESQFFKLSQIFEEQL